MSERPMSSRRILLAVGSLGPLGHVPASGTVTAAVVGIPAYLLLHAYLPWWGYGLFLLVFTGLAVWVHDVGDRLLGEKDSHKLVLDELVGYWIAMTAVPPFGVPASVQLIVLGFLLERGIDIAKVWPARWIERCCPGGWGVVGDDVLAGLYTLALLYLAMWRFPGLLGIA